MLRHILVFKMKETALGKTDKENVVVLKQMIDALYGVIPQLKKMDTGYNLRKGTAEYDLGLYSEFDSVEDLNIYRDHPAHVKVLEFIKETVADRKVVDWE